MLLANKDSIRILNPSAAKRNKKGERGSPCLRPLSKENSSVGDPFTKTEAVAITPYLLFNYSWLSLESFI